MPRILNSLVILISVSLGIFVHPGLFGILGLTVITIAAEIVMSVESNNTATGLLYLFRTKRVKTEFGRFYLFISRDGDEVILVQDKIFYYKYIFKVDFDPDQMDDLKRKIKYYTDSLYEGDIKKKESINKLKNWNGYLDKQSERDGKLEELGV